MINTAEFAETFRRELDEGLVPARVLNDPELYSLERDRLFPRVWSFIGHESEISKPGDYALRYIGEDPFVFVRDEHGEIHVLFNACRHRGTQICRAETGNTSHFRCPYHGWTYDNAGNLVGMPAAKDTAIGLDRSQWGLIEAAQVDTYGGMVFACLDPEAPSLAEYLGDTAYYLDMLFELNDFEVVGAPHRWIMDANWKSGAENFGGDDYHLLYLHRSMFDVGAIQIPFHANMIGHHVLTGNGHALDLSIAENPDELAFWGFPEEITSKYDRSRLDPAQFNLAQRSRVFVGTVFPNLSFIAIPLTGSPRKQAPTGFVNLRLWQPRGSGRMELWNWVLVPKDASPDFRHASYQASMQTFSASGLFDQDDSEPWQSMARTGASTFARQQNMRLNYQMGLNVGTAQYVEDWPGPGLVSAHRYEDGAARAIYERWLEYLTSEAYPPSSGPPELPAERAATTASADVANRGSR